MNQLTKELNDVLLAKCPKVYEMLSEKGKAIYFPKTGILGQSAEAKNTKINATIGAAIEDDGSPMRLASIDSKIDMDPSMSFPYAPSYGRPDLRARWKQMIFEKNEKLKGHEISLPVVTNALTHGISMVGYLFADPGQEIIVSNYFWDNYDLIFKNGYDAPLKEFNLFKNGGFDVESMKSALLTDGEKKVIILNFPNNPSGYTPTFDEMKAITAALKEVADKGKKIVVVIDDAYFGLVFEEGIEPQSIFAYIADLHENILAVKVDGPTKEDYVWGFRVGFISYNYKGADASVYSALESKTAGAVRGNISNASNLSQSLLLSAFDAPTYAKEKQEKFDIMKARYNACKEVLKDSKYSEYFSPLPYNSGYFMCVIPKNGINCEELRALLIKKYGIGVINLNNVIRIAFAAVAAKDIKPLFEGLHEACKELSSK